MILTGAKKAQDQDTVGFWPVDVGACNRSGVCSQTAGFSAHALCHWQVASCSNYLPMCSPSSGAACKRGVVLTLPANGFSKPVAGSRF